MKLKKIISVICSTVIAASIMIFPVSSATSSNTVMRDISTMELVREMGLGINLGNTYESCGDWINKNVNSYIKAWGSPLITQNIIQGYADEGFGVLRIPVAWSNLMSDDYTISATYLASVKKVIDWTLDSGMYAIVNLHWDGGWINNFPTNETENMKKYTAIWTQLSEAFKDYGDYLIFESQNEELGWSTLSQSASYTLVNKINQEFVNIVRNSGGNNAKRHLLIAGYGTDITKTCNALFKMPTDSMNRCAVSVHYYTPSTFAILEEDASWGKCRTTWGTASDFTELNKYMDMVKTNFIDKGIPVIVGEYGCPTKNKDADSVRLFLKSVCEAAYSRQLCPVLWDITGLHYSRTTYKMNDQQLKADFQNILSQSTQTTLIGDISGNNAIDLYDAIIISKYILKKVTFTEEQKLIADYNGDGKIDLYDVIAVAKFLIKKNF